MTPSFWSGRRVFVTGHTGFKGSWLTLWLHSLGAEICGYALEPPTSPSLFESADVTSLCQSMIGDVRDFARLSAAIRGFRPEIVIHMAAQALVRASYAQPIETYSTNVMGTVHVLEAARQCSNIAAIVNVTSDKCYENREWVWGYRENDPMGGHDPYSSSKGCAELVASAYGRSFFYMPEGPRLASARAGNVIGGGDWATDRLVPDIIRGIMQNTAISIRRPDSVRPWQHVLEPLSGYLLLAEKLVTQGQSVSGAWNFGPSQASVQTVRVVADQICSLWHSSSSWIDASEPNAVHEARLLQLDSTKAHIDLGWVPRWAFTDAIRETVEWYQCASHGEDVKSLCFKQIANYTGALSKFNP